MLDHNAIGMEVTGFEMGINHFSDLTEEEFMKQTTSKLNVPKSKVDVHERVKERESV